MKFLLAKLANSAMLRLPTYLHRKTFFVVFVADVVFYSVAFVLADYDITSWLIAGPVLLLNLPSLPFACLLAAFSEDGPDQKTTLPVLVSYYVIFFCVQGLLVLFSSYVWAFVASVFIKKMNEND